ncbi:T6SS immunity protein Tli3 family protein [Burkholderia sp. Leaf177]|uniref:T6SS immunity protein Tli3 family protein n=1 Tax=Burkholderia sp. Leaf177 TaxID=1736287 RepID=UPI000A6F3A5F|nr:hypothetical protein [Burkholderia sp. Leaf177]
MKCIATVGLLVAVLTLAGCRTDYEDMTAAQHIEYSRHARSIYSYKPDPNAPIQMTYRIDDHRFMTLENYDNCYGDNYYNNTRLGIHQKIWTGKPTGYKGRVVIDDPSGMNVVVPTARNSSCGDRGCTSYFAYSTDSGRTFRWLDYKEYSSLASEDSANFTIAVAAQKLYVIEKILSNSYVKQYPLIPGIDISKPYPPGVKGDGFSASSRPTFMVQVRTPSGQDRFTCDASIRSAGQPKTP